MPDIAIDAHRRQTPIDHPDRSVTRAKLEYPTTGIPLSYLIIAGRYVIAKDDNIDCFLTADSFADRAISALQIVGSVDGTGFGVLIARYVNSSNFYRSLLHAPLANDFQIQKYVNASWTTLAQEAVSLTGLTQFTVTFSISGTTLKAWRQLSRNLAATPTLTATDTAISSGRWGGRNEAFFFELLSPASPSPQPIGYFEVPVVGSGTSDDPFRPQMPEEIVDHPTYGLVDRLALTWSALIVSDYNGKPKEYTAIVRVLEQQDRQAHLYPINKCIEKLREIKGARKLERDEAIKRAKQLDDRLTDIDLLPIDKFDRQFKVKLKDYIAHKISLGVREELIDEKIMEQYLVEDKGW